MDISEKDTIYVAVKKQAKEYLIKYYAAFGWQLVEQKDDERYEDTDQLIFERPHFIENKDELHLLQAKLEIAMNRTGKYERSKTSRTTIFGLCLGLLAAAFIAGGVCLIVLLGGILAVVFGSIACAIGVAIGIACAVFSRKIYKSDSEKCRKLILCEIDKMESYCKQAKAIRGEL